MDAADIRILELTRNDGNGEWRAAGVADRAGFQLRWRAYRGAADRDWTLEGVGCDGIRRQRIDAFEIVTDDDFEAFRRLVVAEIERPRTRGGGTG